MAAHRSLTRATTWRRGRCMPLTGANGPPWPMEAASWPLEATWKMDTTLYAPALLVADSSPIKQNTLKLTKTRPEDTNP